MQTHTLICTGLVLLFATVAHADWTQQDKLTADDGANQDAFGQALSVSGDYTVVGAYGDDPNGSMSGSAYIFNRTGSAWTQQAKLTADDGAASDYFGRFVSISGNYAIVGAERDDDNGDSSGSVYIFEKPAGGWVDMTQTAKLTPDDGAASDFFGRSISISGDYAVVGAYGDGGNTGSAYIFQRTGSTWTQQAKLTADDAAVSDRFGWSVSISGDYVVVGAYADDDNGINSGSAYVFEKPGGGWADMTQTAKLTADDGAALDSLGYSVSISGNYAVVGAYEEDDNGSASGSAYIFEKPAGGWADMTETAKLTADDGAASDWFGFSVSIDGDYALAGAWGDDDNGDGSGSVYLFEMPAGGWADMTQTAKLTADDGAASDYFGYSVSIDSNYTVVGAQWDDDNGSASGSAYVFAVPEPGTLWLLGLGGLALLRRRRR